MFGEIESIYPFKHVIYTLYASPDSGESTGFYHKHKGNRGGDRPIDDSHLTPKFVEQVHKLGKRVYVHTIQTYESLTKYAAINVDGFYTGLLTPQDMAVYESVSK